MKKRLFAILTMTLMVMTVSAQRVVVFVTDSDPFTNLRDAPKGKVIGKIDNKLSAMVVLENYTNGWWKLAETPSYAEDDAEIPLQPSATGYWIHYSTVGFGTRNYGGQTLHLRKSPDDKAPITYSFSKELTLHPIGVQGDWVKVKTGDGKHSGWIEMDWICANPLTNCC